MKKIANVTFIFIFSIIQSKLVFNDNIDGFYFTKKDGPTEPLVFSEENIKIGEQQFHQQKMETIFNVLFISDSPGYMYKSSTGGPIQRNDKIFMLNSENNRAHIGTLTCKFDSIGNSSKINTDEINLSYKNMFSVLNGEEPGLQIKERVTEGRFTIRLMKYEFDYDPYTVEKAAMSNKIHWNAFLSENTNPFEEWKDTIFNYSDYSVKSKFSQYYEDSMSQMLNSVILATISQFDFSDDVNASNKLKITNFFISQIPNFFDVIDLIYKKPGSSFGAHEFKNNLVIFLSTLEKNFLAAQINAIDISNQTKFIKLPDLNDEQEINNYIQLLKLRLAYSMHIFKNFNRSNVHSIKSLNFETFHEETNQFISENSDLKNDIFELSFAILNGISAFVNPQIVECMYYLNNIKNIEKFLRKYMETTLADEVFVNSFTQDWKIGLNLFRNFLKLSDYDMSTMELGVTKLKVFVDDNNRLLRRLV